MSDERFRPMLACDADLDLIRFPAIVQPKVDGVRGLVVGGKLVGRSLKKPANRKVVQRLSHPLLNHLDGELWVGSAPYNDDLCRNTTSAINRIGGNPPVRFLVFDYFAPKVKDLPYQERLQALVAHVATLPPHFNVQAMPTWMVHNMDHLLDADSELRAKGYEGTIVRDPAQPYKFGRSTAREGGLLRIKKFAEGEAVVLEIVEGQHNQNEAKVNELGHTERSSHQANMVPNGMVGSLVCKCIATAATITVSPGKMTHEERMYYFENPDQLVGTTIKYKFFPRGQKDKPRFPTFQSIRAESDIDRSGM